MRPEVKPFTEEEIRRFDEYCYVVFGLHVVGDLLDKHSVMDGKAIVHQIRQANETIKEMKPIYDAGIVLGGFIREDGTVVDGFRTKELLLQIRQAFITYWNKEVKD